MATNESLKKEFQFKKDGAAEAVAEKIISAGAEGENLSASAPGPAPAVAPDVKYRSLNVIEIHEGELISWNPLTEELVIDMGGRKSDLIIGYAGYFELPDGFRKTLYLPSEEVEKYKGNSSENAAELKIIVRNMLSKWEILKGEMYYGRQ
ncbi:MAG: recombinase RecT [Clostridiaceae bacterium]